MNILTFTTRFGQDATTKYTQAGKPVTTVRCPVDAGWGDNKHTSWVTVVIFGERGEKLAPMILKGGKATVAGELKIREFESNGEKRLAVEVIMREIDLHDGKRSGSPGAQSSEPQGGQPQYPQGDGFEDDDIPFSPLDWRVF